MLGFSSLEEEIRAVQDALAEIVTPDPDGAIQTVYPRERRMFGQDDFTVLSIQSIGFNFAPDRTQEIPFPNMLSYAVRAYYPIVDTDPERDGLEVADEKCLAALSEFYSAVVDDQRLNSSVIFAGITGGRILGVEEGGLIVYGWEADVRVKVH